MDYRDNRQRWAESHQVVHFYAGQWCTFTPALTLPTDQGEQGRLFYKIYSTYSNAVGVLDAHRSYLAARDIAMINLILSVLLPGFALWATGDGIRTVAYIGVLFLCYLLAATAAQVYGVRLVENTLAAASADQR